MDRGALVVLRVMVSGVVVVLSCPLFAICVLVVGGLTDLRSLPSRSPFWMYLRILGR